MEELTFYTPNSEGVIQPAEEVIRLPIKAKQQRGIRF